VSINNYDIDGQPATQIRKYGIIKIPTTTLCFSTTQNSKKNCHRVSTTTENGNIDVLGTNLAILGLTFLPASATGVRKIETYHAG